MRSLATLTNSKFICLFLITLIFTACSKKEKQDKYIVKLNDSVLSQKMLDSALTSEANSAKGRTEFINDWIETEILYQEALKEGITKEDDFISLLNKSKKELAGTLLLKRIIDKENIEPADDDVKKYYEESKEDFRLRDDLFILNVASFAEYNKAVQFRNKLLETNWLAVESAYRADQTVSVSKNKMYYGHELQPVIFYRVINSLLPGETSIILEKEPGNYSIVQIIEKFGKDSLPSFEYVKEEAKQKLIVLRKKEFLHNYINKLISDQNLEIERYSE